MKRLLTLILLLVSLTATGQKKKDNFFHDLNEFLEMREQKAYAKLDTSYIGRYDYPWNGKTFIKSTGLHMSSTFGGNIALATGLRQRVGLGISYRGFGLSYSRALGKRFNVDLGIDSYGKHFCFEYTLKATTDLAGSIHLTTGDYNVDDVNKLLLFSNKLNLLYSFNSRFSYAAAMKQSKIQRRSAGSFIAGLSWAVWDILILDENPSWYDMYEFNYFYQRFSIGAGYGYNLVLGRQHWLLHASLVPMWSFYEMQGYRSKGVVTRESYPYGHFAFAGTARAGVYYRWGDRWSVGFSGVVNQMVSSNLISRKNPDYMRFGAQEWHMNITLNCRF